MEVEIGIHGLRGSLFLFQLMKPLMSSCGLQKFTEKHELKMTEREDILSMNIKNQLIKGYFGGRIKTGLADIEEQLRSLAAGLQDDGLDVFGEEAEELADKITNIIRVVENVDQAIDKQCKNST